MLYKIVIAIIITCATSAGWADKPPKIREWKGLYSQEFFSNTVEIIYIVDPQIKTCFAVVNEQLTVLDCFMLAQRPEWQSIINWQE